MLQRGARSSLYVSTFLPECKAEAISEKAVNISITFYCPYHECLMNIVNWFLVVASSQVIVSWGILRSDRNQTKEHVIIFQSVEPNPSKHVEGSGMTLGPMLGSKSTPGPV